MSNKSTPQTASSSKLSTSSVSGRDDTLPPAPAEDTGKIPVEFVEPDGSRRILYVLLGQRLLDAALDAGVAGISGQCGGAINCATCLCNLHIPPAGSAIGKRLRDALPAPHPDEVELLEWVDEASTNSRLSCQIIATPELANLILEVVPTL